MGSVIDVDAQNWEREVLQSNTVVVVEFWHEQCVWCKRLEPIYREVAEQYKGKLKFARLNVLANHDNRHLAIHYGVLGTPTLMFFCEGRPIGAAVGFHPKDKLTQLVEDVLLNHQECVKRSTRLEDL